jgi:hypothetical protein
MIGSPAILSHAPGGLDAMINIQIIGSQMAPVTLGFSRKSRRKRKAMNPKVRTRANVGGIWIIYYWLTSELLESQNRTDPGG